MSPFQSWGGVPNHQPKASISKDWRLEPIAGDGSLLPYGNGRSYGDVCQNQSGTLLRANQLDRFLEFDREAGVITVESGMLLGELIELTLPAGWFLPVVPGTQFVSVGGAVANDVHGKNHQKLGSFGCHIIALELLRSNGDQLLCSPEEQAELFAATIGGLGLTGLISWVTIQLIPVRSELLEAQNVPFHSLAEYQQIDEASADWDYTVSWIDCLHPQGRGIYSRARHVTESHADSISESPKPRSSAPKLSIPITPPFSLVNNVTLRAFNQVYFHWHKSKDEKKNLNFQRFFFPLDNVGHWNRLYGKKGFYQYQCVVPSLEAIGELLHHISQSNCGSFLTVLKRLGEVPSPGLLSFPRPGYTLAVDFPNNGPATLKLLSQLDAIVKAAKGSVYLAKDARLPADTFRALYPRWQEFQQYIDPQFSSSLWRRMQ